MTTWKVTRSRASTCCVAWACPAKQAWAPRGATAPAPQLATQVFPELPFRFNITFQLSRVNPKTLNGRRGPRMVTARTAAERMERRAEGRGDAPVP